MYKLNHCSKEKTGFGIFDSNLGTVINVTRLSKLCHSSESVSSSVKD